MKEIRKNEGEQFEEMNEVEKNKDNMRDLEKGK